MTRQWRAFYFIAAALLFGMVACGSAFKDKARVMDLPRGKLSAAKPKDDLPIDVCKPDIGPDGKPKNLGKCWVYLKSDHSELWKYIRHLEITIEDLQERCR